MDEGLRGTQGSTTGHTLDEEVAVLRPVMQNVMDTVLGAAEVNDPRSASSSTRCDEQDTMLASRPVAHHCTVRADG